MKTAVKGGRILVADDDLISRRYFKASLERAGHGVTMVEDGLKARQAIEAAGPGGFDCLLTDYRMPQLNGLDLVQWVRSFDPTLSAVMVTAEGEKSLVAESMRGGVYDFLDKPVTSSLLASVIAKAVGATAERRESAQAIHSAREIGQLQTLLINAERLKSSQGVEVRHHPRHEAGGDFIMVDRHSDQGTLILAGDVSGHDLKAAFISAFFQGMARGMLQHSASVSEVLTQFNRFLLEEWHPAQSSVAFGEISTSLAVCAACIDPASETVLIHNHGFCIPVYVNQDGFATRCGDRGGTPLGWFEQFSSSPQRIFTRGGAMLLWSDGLDDLAIDRNIHAEALAFRMLRATDPADRASILEGAKDDVTAVRVDITRNVPGHDFHPLIIDVFPGNGADEIDHIQESIRRSLDFALPAVDPRRIFDVLLCAREAILNAMNHGCAGSSEASCEFQISFSPSQSILRIHTRDPGPGFDGGFLTDPETDESGMDRHCGMILLKNLPDRVLVEKMGAQLTFDFQLETSARAA